MSDESINDLLKKKGPVEICIRAKHVAMVTLVTGLTFLFGSCFSLSVHASTPLPFVLFVAAMVSFISLFDATITYFVTRTKVRKGITDEEVAETVFVIKESSMTEVLSDHVRDHGELSWENWADLMQSLNQECKRRHAESISEALRLAGRPRKANGV